MTDDLVNRLRDWSEYDEGKINDAREEAADKIEQLQKQTTLYFHAFNKAMSRIEELETVLRGEPTLKMLLAGKKSLYSCSEDPEIEDAEKCFEAMIAALGEKKE